MNYRLFLFLLTLTILSCKKETTPPISEKKEIIRWAKSVKWMKLEVLNTTQGSSNDNEGTVEFKAYFKEGFVTTYIHENSYFTKENGNWVYVGEAK